MAVTSGFFNSINHDRTYNAEQFSRLFDGIISDGIIENVGGFMHVKPSSGMTIAVSSGRAWFNHTWTDNDSDFYITLPNSDVLLNRIDAVVLKVNLATRSNELTIVRGTPSANAVKPTWTNGNDIYQYALAYVHVNHEVTEITANDIENAIGMNLETPFVTGILQHATIEELYDFWRQEFEEWLDHLADELDENQAAHLQHQIDDLVDVEFKHYHDLCNSTVTYEYNNGKIVGIECKDFTNTITDTATITRSSSNVTIIETITTSDYRYIKTMIYDKTLNTLTNTYTKEAIL